MKTAMDNVQLAYQIGDQKCQCPTQAATLAKQTGETKFFLVGEEKTECEVTARLNLARAKYKAAVEALVEAQKQTQVEAPQAQVQAETPAKS
jgi:hypothetical protein